MSKSNPHLNARNEAAVDALIADDMAKMYFQTIREHQGKTAAIAELVKFSNTTKSAARAAAWYW